MVPWIFIRPAVPDFFTGPGKKREIKLNCHPENAELIYGEQLITQKQETIHDQRKF